MLIFNTTAVQHSSGNALGRELVLSFVCPDDQMTEVKLKLELLLQFLSYDLHLLREY